MKFSNSRILVGMVAIAVLLGPAAKRAHADTYEIYDLGSGYQRYPVGIESSGAVVIVLESGNCSLGPFNCWQTWVDGVDVGQVTTDPNPGYDNGTICTPNASSTFSGFVLAAACNNGREVYGTSHVAPAPYQDTIFDGPNPLTDVVETGVDMDMVKLNSSGDFVFYANEGTGVEGGGEIYEAIHQTPEPASFLLLGTGVLAMLGATRRRLLAAR